MIAKTTGQRVLELRQRRASLGLIRLEIYVHPDDHEAVKGYAAKLQRGRSKFAKLVKAPPDAIRQPRRPVGGKAGRKLPNINRP